MLEEDDRVRDRPLRDRAGEGALQLPGLEVRDLAELVIELTGSSSEIIHEPLPEDDPKVRRPDISVAKAKLGWEPRVPVRDGLTRTIEFFRSLGASSFIGGARTMNGVVGVQR